MRAAERWRRLVQDRLREYEQLRSDSPASASFWDANADRFARRFSATGESDPVLPRLRATLRSTDTLVDVGAGAGRYAVPLASTADRVVAVDPSQRMLRLLQEHAMSAGVRNIEVREGHWPAVTARGDVLVCAYVLPMVEDVASFLRALDGAADREVIVALSGTTPGVLQEPLWSYFHGRRPPPAPTYLDVAAVLAELGIEPTVDVFEAPPPGRCRDLDDAVSEYRTQLFLPEHIGDAELRDVLASWLVEEASGWRVPYATVPIALVYWTPDTD